MRIGATTLGFGSATIEEVFDGLVAVGAQCCELNARPGQHGGEVLTAARLRPLIAATGVAVTSVGGYNDFTEPDVLAAEVERLLVACRLASELEVPFVRTMVGDEGLGKTLESVRASVVEGLRRAAAAAAPLGVTLAVENHGRLANDGPWLASVVREVGAPNVGHTLDTGNFAWAGRDPETVAGDIAAVLPRTVSVHIKDVRWRDGSYECFVPAGEGEIDLVGTLTRLRELGYAGPVISEYEGAGSHREGTIASIRALRRIAAEVSG